ncbi:MAG: zinc ribbon domain-containing protein [Aeromicrobium sp.]
MPSLPYDAVVQWPHPSEPGFLDAALDHLLSDESEEPRLLVHDGSPVSERRLRLLRSVYGDFRMLPVGVRRPLSGLASTATVLAGLADLGVAPGAVISGMPMIVAHARIDAVSHRVSGLDLPGIGLRHHLVSMIPGAVVRLRFADRIEVGVPRSVQDTDAVSGPDTVIVRAGNPGLAGKLPSRGLPVSEGQFPTIDVTGSDPVASGWWGTRNYYERCVLASDLRGLASRITAGPWRRCPECGESVSSHCRFCSAQEAFA